MEVRKEGFEGQARTVYIEPCKVRELTFRLIMPATLRIISDPPGAEAYVDEKYFGKTPLELVLEPGDHWIELRFRGGRFEPWSRWIHLRPGEEKTLRALIPPRVGIPPEAVFWISPEDPLTGVVVVFDASASRDPDGWVVSYSWDFDGDGEPDAEGARVTCVFGEPGIHRVRLTVTDDDGFTDSVEFSFRVRARPVAAFTGPERAFMGELVKFDASPSHDPDGRIVSYHWDFGDGEEATGSAVEHAFTVPGTYRVTLTVRDDDGLTGEASREIEVVRGGEIPISSDPPGAEVYLDGRHIGTTPLRTEKLPEGDYRIKLKLVGYRDWSTTVHVPEEGEVEAALVPLGTLLVRSDPPGAEVYLDGRFVGRTSPEGLKLYTEGEHCLAVRRCGYLVWEEEVSLESGETQEIRAELRRIEEVLIETEPPGAEIYLDGRLVGKSPAKVPFAPGELLLVKEGYKPWSTSCVTAGKLHVVLKENMPPVARISAPEQGIALEEIPFSAFDSADPDGEIVEYRWEFGDGGEGKGEAVWHRYVAPGTYTVRLTVTDDGGAVGEATWEISISARPLFYGSLEPRTLLFGFDLGRNREGVWSIGFTVGRELALGGSLSFTGEKVPEYYEVPPQTWQGEAYNLGPEYEVCLLAGTDFLMGISLEFGLGVSFQQRVHIATAEAPEGRLAPKRAVVLPNGYRVWERYFTFQGRLSLALEGVALDLGYHSRRGWVVGLSLEF